MFNKLALALLIIGGLNWGAIGIFQFDVVAWISLPTMGTAASNNCFP